MKLSRRSFLKALGAGAVGTALGRRAQAESTDKPASCTGEWTSDMLPVHEPLAPFDYACNPYIAHITTGAGVDIPVFSDIEVEVATGYVDTEFDSMHSLGLGVGDCAPASLTLKQDGELFLQADGYIRLHGITAGRKDIVYHYGFGGHELEEGNRETE